MSDTIRARCEEYLEFEEHPDFLRELKELMEHGDEETLSDRCYTRLAFGTGGLRGIIGAGYNRMNPYIIRKSTTGLANYINKMVRGGSVAIAYDSRNFSDLCGSGRWNMIRLAAG